MGKIYDAIDDRMAAWLERQPVFFVGTAPLAGDGLVNVSPKGTAGTFRVLDGRTVGYLDLTGSGVETVAHLRENGRICVMFCAFEGPPKIVRLHGVGSVCDRNDPDFGSAITPFERALTTPIRRAAARAVITVRVDRISDSCGYSVPFLRLDGERDVLDSWSDKRGEEGLDRYRAERNAVSLDGLPALGRTGGG